MTSKGKEATHVSNTTEKTSDRTKPAARQSREWRVETVAVDTEERRTAASEVRADGCGWFRGPRRRSAGGLRCVFGAAERVLCVCFVCVLRVFCVLLARAKGVKKLALVGLDPTTFGL